MYVSFSVLSSIENGDSISTHTLPFASLAFSGSSRREVAIGVGLVAVGGVVGMLVGYFWGKKQARINHKHRLQTDKVVDTIDMEDIGEKKAFCRCWHSNKVSGGAVDGKNDFQIVLRWVEIFH